MHKQFRAPSPASGDTHGQSPAEESLPRPVKLSRRRHPRYKCEGRAEVFVPHGALLFQGRILNLSLSGCFIESRNLNLERGTRVEVSFVARQLQVRVAGHIAILYRNQGVGIAFDNPNPRQNRQITELVMELGEQSVSTGFCEKGSA